MYLATHLEGINGCEVVSVSAHLIGSDPKVTLGSTKFTWLCSIEAHIVESSLTKSEARRILSVRRLK